MRTRAAARSCTRTRTAPAPAAPSAVRGRRGEARQAATPARIRTTRRTGCATDGRADTAPARRGSAAARWSRRPCARRAAPPRAASGGGGAAAPRPTRWSAEETCSEWVGKRPGLRRDGWGKNEGWGKKRGSFLEGPMPRRRTQSGSAGTRSSPTRERPRSCPTTTSERGARPPRRGQVALLPGGGGARRGRGLAKGRPAL